MVALYLLVIAAGLFMIAVVVFNWEWWFFDAESRGIEMIGGENWVRVYWAVGGMVLIASTLAYWIWGWGW